MRFVTVLLELGAGRTRDVPSREPRQGHPYKGEPTGAFAYPEIIMKSSRMISLACVAAVTGVLLTGCLPDDSAPAPQPTRAASVTPIPITSPSALPSVTSKPSATPTKTYGPITAAPEPAATTTSVKASAAPTRKVDPNAPKGQCADKDMLTSVQQDPEGGGDGQRRAFVVIENISNSTCTLRGYPGVSLVGGGNGTQIGHPASKIDTNTSPKTIQVGRGDYVVAIVNYIYIDKNEKTFSDGKTVCNAKHADGYRVYPPHSYNSAFTPYDTYACSGAADWIGVGAIELNHYDFTPQLGK